MTDQYYITTTELDTPPAGVCTLDHAPIERSSAPRPTGPDGRVEARSICAALARHLGRPVKVLDLWCRPNRPSPASPPYPAPPEDAPVDCDLALCVVSGPNRDASDRVGLLSTALGLAHTAGVVLFETAWEDDPADRHDVPPDDLQRLRRAFAFVHTIAEYDDAGQGRGLLLFCSNRYWYADGRLGAFDSWRSNPNELLEEGRRGTRRYFFGADTVIKNYCFHGQYGWKNRRDMALESSFLSRPPITDESIPRLIAHHAGIRDGVLVMERLPGILLTTAILQGRDYDPTLVLRNVLERAYALERVGLYHRDFGPWNILLNDDGDVALIDFASITSRRRHARWPHDPIVSFFLFAAELVNRRMQHPSIEPLPLFPLRSHRRYRRWASLVLTHPSEERSFALLRAYFEGVFDGHPHSMKGSGVALRAVRSRSLRRFLYWPTPALLQMCFFIISLKRGRLRRELGRALRFLVRSFTARPVTALAPIGRPRP